MLQVWSCGGMPKQINDTKRLLVVLAYQQGLSCRKVGQVLGVSNWSVVKTLTEAQIPIRNGWASAEQMKRVSQARVKSIQAEQAARERRMAKAQAKVEERYSLIFRYRFERPK